MQVKNKLFEMDSVMEIVPEKYEDDRGYFTEIYNERVFVELGIRHKFVQDNMAYSNKVGTIRGLHFQVPPAAQAKLIRAVRGQVRDVFVDIRKGSPTYKKWASIILKADSGNQLYLPVGFAHGYITLESHCEIAYKVSDYYVPECELGIRWNDPDLDIDWGQDKNLPVLSDKDMKLPFLSEIDSPFIYQV